MHRLFTSLILAIVAVACGKENLPTSPDQLTLAIVAFGDSLTSGPGVAPAQTYPALLQQRILSDGYRYRVINAGVTGDTTSEALPRFNDALVPETRIVILALGINDGLRGVPIATVERNLMTMIERARSRNIAVLLCGMEAPPIGGFNYSIEFHRIYSRLAERYTLPLVPFFLLRVAGDPDLNLDDRFHPNAAGHRVIAETIWPYLRPMLISPATGGNFMRVTRLTVSTCAFAAFILAGLSIGKGQAPAPETQKPGAQAQPAQQPPPLLHAQNLIMMPDEHIKVNNNRVFGSANQTGFYITRNIFRNNNTSRPHYHTMDRWVTVIKGTWWGGTGKVFRPKEMKPMPAGSVMYHPAYFIHYDGNQDGGETIVQIMGYGPVTTVQVEEDEKGNPVNRGGEGAGYATSPPPAGAKPVQK